METSTKINLRSIFLAIMLLASMITYAALGPNEEFAYYKSKYPEEAAIYLSKKEEVKYSIINDSLITTITVYEEILHLGDNTKRFASETIYSSTFNEVSNIEAYTLVPGKRKYQKIEVTEFKESFDDDSNVFYDDSKTTSFNFPAIQKGAKTILTYTKTLRNPRLMNLFFIDTYIPVHEASYVVEYDNNITINPFLFNTEKNEIKTENKVISENRSAIRYTSSNIDKIRFENDCPSYNYMATKIYSPVASYIKSNGEKVQLISTTENLHTWYRTFLKDLLGRDDEVKELAESIINPGDPVMEKVEKIYYWVQANIKYIAFEDGMRGFIPHQGNYVINKRYGDCKDMTSAIVSMLREVDIDARYTWVGSRDLPFKYSETPSPITDNHMIATFEHEGETYYLDATGQYTPLDLPTSMIQGKECLISKNEHEFIIKEIPVINKEKNIMTDSISINIDPDGLIHGNGHVTLTGYAKVFNAYKLIKSNQKSIDDYVHRLLLKGSNKFHLDTFMIANTLDLNKPTTINYEFKVNDYYSQVGDDIYINPVLNKTMTDALIENRTVPLSNDYKYINRNIVMLNIPEGYELVTLPDNINNPGTNFGFSITYTTKGAQVLITKEFYLDYLLMKPDEFDSWNLIIDDYAKACRTALILRKK